MIRHVYILIGLSILLFFCFALLSKYEDRASLRNLDFAVTVKVQERIDRSTHLRLADFVGNVMEGATYFAAPGFTSVAVIVLTGYGVYDWKKRKVRLSSMIIPVGFILILLAELFGKSIVHHPSPPFSMIKHPTSMFPANYINEQFSYPSGHAARAIYIGMVIYSLVGTGVSARSKRRGALIIGICLYVVLVGVSRIYLGEHWFTDVVGGVLIGAGTGLVAHLILVRTRHVGTT